MPRKPDPDQYDNGTRTCPPCGGSGSIWNDHVEGFTICGLCNGAGRISRKVFEDYMSRSARP